MEKKNVHFVEIDPGLQVWVEYYAERKNLSINETLIHMLIAGRFALERQETEIANLKKRDPELPPRIKIGVQASVECLSILRKVYLPELNDQKQLAREVKELIERTIMQTANEREDVVT